MSEPLHGGQPTLLVLHRSVPGPTSSDPHTRQVARRIELLHRLTGGAVRVVGLEQGPGSDDRWLRRIGVPVRAVPAGTAAGLAEELAGCTAAWITDLGAAVALRQTFEAAGRSVPYLLELDQAPSHTARHSGHRPDARNTDGLEHLVAARRAAERPVLRDAAAVAATTADLAGHLAELVGPDGPRPEVVVPCAVPAPSRREAHQREGIVTYGRWVGEEGSPDEDGLGLLLTALADQPDLPATLLATDAPPRHRQGITRRLAIADPAAWAATLRTARVVVMARRFGAPQAAAAAEVLAEGVPLLTSPGVTEGRADEVADPGAWAARIHELATDPRAWARAARRAEEAARGWLDPATVTAQTTDLLARLGIAPGALAEPATVRWMRVPPSPGWLPAGTSRTALDLVEFDRRLQGDAFLPRTRALLAQVHLTGDEGYRLWAAAHDDGPARQAALRRRAEGFRIRPRFSLVMPTYDSDPVHLMEAIASVRAQTWTDWQLCIADDASPDPRTRAALERHAALDDRITVTYAEANGGIAAATNAALATATGDFVAFLDHDDVLRPTALHWVAELLQEAPDLDVIYTDEDRLDPEGRLARPSFKPDWSPDLLASVNYVCHLTVIRRALVEELGGLRPGFDGAQDYDLLLRATERTDRVGHVAKPLYSWRMTERSTATSADAKPEAGAASRRALAEALARRGVTAEIAPGLTPTWHQVRHPVAGDPLISILVPTRDRVDLLAECVQHVRQRSGGRRVQIVVVDNDSRQPESLAYLDQLDRAPDAVVVRYPERFNYARQMNLAAAVAEGELLLLLNNDARPLTPDWLTVLAGHALRPEVGAVGARLLFPDGVIQHEGIALHVGDEVAWNIRGTDVSTLSRNTRNTAAVTGACLMVRRGVWEAVGGMDEQLRVAFNDVDLCLRIGELGYRIVYTPWAELEHAESSSRGTLHPLDDEAFYRNRWGHPNSGRDPFYATPMDMADPTLRLRI